MGGTKQNEMGAPHAPPTHPPPPQTDGVEHLLVVRDVVKRVALFRVREARERFANASQLLEGGHAFGVDVTGRVQSRG